MSVHCLHVWLSVSEMCLLHLFKQKDGLPDLTGVLSTFVPSTAIAQDRLPDPTGVLSTFVPSTAIAQDRLPDPTGVLSTFVPSTAIAQANREVGQG